MRTLRPVALCLMMAFDLSLVHAQSATVTNNILFRTFLVKSDKEAGTIFSVDVDGREYWITAKHILTGAKHPPHGSVDAKSVMLSILPQLESGKDWMSFSFSVIDPGKDIDIVVLAPAKPLLPSTIIQTAAVKADNTMIGGSCEFVGFPYGVGWITKFEERDSVRLPFIKHCTVSGMITSPVQEWVLDGINNGGFSGGPVVFGAESAQQVIGVVSGFGTEPIEVVPLPEPGSNSSAQPHPKEAALANSGFIFAYNITSAIEAIKKNPIGPLITERQKPQPN